MNAEEQRENMKKCPECAEEIAENAEVCEFCGAKFDVSKKAYCHNCQKVVAVTPEGKCANCDGGQLMDVHFESNLIGRPQAGGAIVAEAPSVAPPAMTQTRLGVSEGFIADARMMFALVTTAVAVALTMASGVASNMLALGSYATPQSLDGNPLLWGLSHTQFAYAPAFFWIGSIIVALVMPKNMKPKLRGIRYRDKREAMRNFKESKKALGASMIFASRRFWLRWTLAMVVWLAMVGLLGSVYSQMVDRSMDVKSGFYLTAGLLVIGFLGILGMIPSGRKNHTVEIGIDGNVTRIPRGPGA